MVNHDGDVQEKIPSISIDEIKPLCHTLRTSGVGRTPDKATALILNKTMYGMQTTNTGSPRKSS